MRRNREAREVRDRSAAAGARRRGSTPSRIKVKARAGEGGKLFGSVTTADIVAAVLERHRASSSTAARSCSTSRSASSARSRCRCGCTPRSCVRSSSRSSRE